MKHTQQNDETNDFLTKRDPKKVQAVRAPVPGSGINGRQNGHDPMSGFPQDELIAGLICGRDYEQLPKRLRVFLPERLLRNVGRRKGK